MPVDPRPLEEVICVTPAMRPNWRSSGVATEEAIVSGLAPGKTRSDRNSGEIDLRQRSYGQKSKSNRAGEKDRDGN